MKAPRSLPVNKRPASCLVASVDLRQAPARIFYWRVNGSLATHSIGLASA
jgi:hypothetical protein